MKKGILLIVILLFLCGCSAEVNLEVSPLKVDETISITSLADGNYTKQNIKDGFRNYIPMFANVEIPDTAPDEAQSGVEYYDHSVEELSNGYKNVYKKSFGFGRYKDARSINEAFRSVNVINDSKEGTLLISTDAGGMKVFNSYQGLDSVRVNIKTDYEVIKHNADSVNGNVYTWFFSKDTRKGIYLLTKNTLDAKKEEELQDDIVKDSSSKSFIDKHPLLIALLGILGFFVLAIIMSKIKIKG